MPFDRPVILMCPPDHFSVDYVINPWMAGNEGALDLGLARAQWDALRDALAAGDAQAIHAQLARARHNRADYDGD